MQLSNGGSNQLCTDVQLTVMLWHFQCSDEISFVSASHPLNLDFFSPKHILVFNQVWMPCNLRVFLGTLKNEKTQNTTFETFPTTKQKTMFNQSQLISETTPWTKLHTFLRQKLMRRNACHGARVLGLFFGCGCHTTAHLGHRWWPWLSYKLQGTELINSWDRGFVCTKYRFAWLMKYSVILFLFKFPRCMQDMFFYWLEKLHSPIDMNKKWWNQQSFYSALTINSRNHSTGSVWIWDCWSNCCVVEAKKRGYLTLFPQEWYGFQIVTFLLEVENGFPPRRSLSSLKISSSIKGKTTVTDKAC